MGHFRGGSAGCGLRVGAAVVLLLIAGGLALGQTPQPNPTQDHAAAPKYMDDSLKPKVEAAYHVVSFAFLLMVVFCGSLMVAVATRFYFHMTRPSDLSQLALTDPWVVAHLPQFEADVLAAPEAEPAAATNTEAPPVSTNTEAPAVTVDKK